MKEDAKIDGPVGSNFLLGSRTGEPPVDYATAVERVRAGIRRETMLSGIAVLIWPNHTMQPQGAALAAGPYMRRMRADGVLGLGKRGYVLLRPNAEIGPNEGR